MDPLRARYYRDGRTLWFIAAFEDGKATPDFLAGYEVDLRAALESAGMREVGRLDDDRDSVARLRGHGSGCDAFNLSNSGANLGVGRHRKNKISRRGGCIVRLWCLYGDLSGK